MGTTAGPTHEGWSPRPRRGFGSWPVIIVAAAVAVVGWWLTRRTEPCAGFHQATAFSGSTAELRRWVGSCPPDLSAARTSLLADSLFAVGYSVGAASILRRWWPLFAARPVTRLARVVVAVPLVAGALELVENAVLLGIVRRYPDDFNARFNFLYDPAVPMSVTTVAWLKVLALGVAALSCVAALMLAYGRRRESGTPPQPRADEDVDIAALAEPSGLGVCCSGGGVRAAAFSLGAIDQLERAGVMDQARWLVAVSGGNYAATSWTLARARGENGHAAADVVRWLRSPIRHTRSGRHRFLLNGPGGLGRSIVAAILYIAFNVAMLAALVAAVAWPIGRLVGSRVMYNRFRVFGALPASLEIRTELWLPGVILLAAAGIVLLASAFPSWAVSRLWRVAALLAAIGVALELLLVVVPWAMVVIGHTIRDGNLDGFVRTAWVTAFLGSLATVWQLVRKPVLNRVTAKLPHLGGVLLAVATLLWGGKVAIDAATGRGLLGEQWRWALIVAGFVVAYLFAGISQLSIHHIYRKRLAGSFGVDRTPDGTLCEPAEHRTWEDLRDVQPELVVCCAQQRTGIAPGGLPASSFTISPDEVRIGGYTTSTDEYLGCLPKGLGCEHAVASWMATSGAAFASAMGRMSKGSTNALMAALNVDLGIWLPNPRLTHDKTTTFPKVRFGYLFKEILGWYDDSDRYVFVADGGHWDNLGLVELLRRRCKTIICIDASGDDAGGFGTLKQAVELAGLELPEIVASIDLSGLEKELTGRDGVLPPNSVTRLPVRYTSPTLEQATGAATPGTTGTIYYAKAQLASDLAVGLRRFAKADPAFPNYSTARLLLTQEQFDKLVTLGRAAGARVVAMLDQDGVTPMRSDQLLQVSARVIETVEPAEPVATG